MTDLLASLVDRALDRTPVLQRRQPTLFEPVAGAAFSEQSQPEQVASLEEKETVTESTPHSEGPKPFVSNASRLSQLSSWREEPESQPVEPRPARRRRVHDSPQRQGDQDDDRFEPVSAASAKKPANVVSREEPPNRELNPSALAKPKEIRVEPARLIETIVESRVDREIVKEHSTDNPAIKEVHTVAQLDSQSKSSRNNDDDDSQGKQPLKAEMKQLTPPKEQTIKPLTQKKPVARRDPTPAVRAIPRAESKHPVKQPTPPVIHVTIGRVEVRATPPAPTGSRVVQRAGPKMSLEDYLRSRGKGN